MFSYFTDIKKCPEGYSFHFKPAKQQGPIKYSSFIVPKKPDGIEGPDFYAIIDRYIERVNKDVSPGPNDQIFFTGRCFPDGSSRFIKSYLGIRELRGVPKHVAECLNLETPEKYTGKFF